MRQVPLVAVVKDPQIVLHRLAGSGFGKAHAERD